MTKGHVRLASCSVRPNACVLPVKGDGESETRFEYVCELRKRSEPDRVATGSYNPQGFMEGSTAAALIIVALLVSLSLYRRKSRVKGLRKLLCALAWLGQIQYSPQ